MPWTYDRAPSFLEQCEKLPEWRKLIVESKVRDAMEGKLQGIRKGKHLYFPLAHEGDCLIAKVDDALSFVEFQRIQLQT